MKIICPQCETAYDVTPATLGLEGRQVRCARCQTVWFAELSKAAADINPGAMPGEPGEAAFASPPFPADGAPLEPGPDETLSGPFTDADLAGAGESWTVPETAGATPFGADPQLDAVSFDAPHPEPPHGEAEFDKPRTSWAPAAPGASESERPKPDTKSSTRRPIRPAKRSPQLAWHARGLTAAIVMLALVDVALILGRNDIVRAMPQTASLYEMIGLPVNLRNLTFKDLKTTQEQHDGATILVVEGTIAATGNKAIDIPRLRFALSAANGHEIYAWTALPARTRLAPGEAMPFRTRLASPPEQGRSVKIRFFNRRDIAAGLS